MDILSEYPRLHEKLMSAIQDAQRRVDAGEFEEYDEGVRALVFDEVNALMFCGAQIEALLPAFRMELDEPPKPGAGEPEHKFLRNLHRVWTARLARFEEHCST